jgi:predicted enzyme related to lactoylglutathione lyase
MLGDPTYIELGVRDADMARAFYSSLFNWKPSGKSGSGQVHTSSLDIGIHDGDEASQFEVFFTVDDLDVSLAKVVELGGKSMSEVRDNSDFGRWVECADNQGVRFGLREPRSEES